MVFTSCSETTAEKGNNSLDSVESETQEYNELTPYEASIIIDKGTEPPGSGIYYNFFENGIYICKLCNAPLFRSDDKFHCGSGWPSFDEVIFGAVNRSYAEYQPDLEVTCSKCGGHLGHVFYNEGHTERNTRYCINSVSLNFVPDDPAAIESNFSYQRAIFAMGRRICF